MADEIRRQRLIVVLRRVEPQARLLEIARELADAGARIFEVTFDSPSAADDITALREELSEHEVMIGAGTLLGVEDVAAAVRASADFGVAPVFDEQVLTAAVEASLPFVAGALTPTEVARAWSGGATFVKLFPASVAGPEMVRELRGPLPNIELVPTGGIDASNAAAFLDAGAAAVGIGGALLRADRAGRRWLIETVRRA
ncbi:MAG: bifunctional 4-hydroxy-2-oxoglutarate aldolase/2-dehydro-3-deoxy-phosphogluconate aldolase [Chloroflexota bacterium]|nr:bifunctional 4-hydroxy-2-oxoglutarate aldolase/2-dehydro-3-deoxy-phosphogluconate aldolase [Chloroflexota bacterium]